MRMLPADGDVLHDRHLVADDGERADDDAGGVIQKHRRSDRRGGMNADLQACRTTGSATAARDRVRFRRQSQFDTRQACKRDVSLEVQKRRQTVPSIAGIVNGDAMQIAARCLDQIGRGMMRLTGNACEKLAISRSLAEPLTDLMPERTAEAGMIEDRGRHRGAKERIAGQDTLRLTANRSATADRWMPFLSGSRPSALRGGVVTVVQYRASQQWRQIAKVIPQKQTARLLSQTGGPVATGSMGAACPRAYWLSAEAKSALRLAVRRGRALLVLRHELVELFLVLGVAQTIQEFPGIRSALPRGAARFPCGIRRRRGCRWRAGRTAKPKPRRPCGHPFHLVLHPLHLVRPAILMTPATHFSAPECEKEKGEADRPPDDEAQDGHGDPAGMPG